MLARMPSFVLATVVMCLAIAAAFASDAAILPSPHRYVPNSVISSAFSIVYMGGRIGGLLSPVLAQER